MSTDKESPSDGIGQTNISPGAKTEPGAVDADTDRFQRQMVANLSAPGSDTITAPESLDESLLDEAMSNGGIAIEVSMPHPYNPQRGFATKVSNRIKPGSIDVDEISGTASSDLGGFSYLRESMDGANIHEAVGIRPITKIEYRDVSETQRAPGLKGLLGGTVTITRQERAGSKPMLHNEIVIDGKQESAVRFVYAATGRDYQDFANRPGNIFEAIIILPESIARRVIAEVKKNPRFVRELTTRMMESQIGIPRKAWEDGAPENQGRPLGPPYKKWDAEPVHKIYVMDKKPSTQFGTFDPSLIVQY